jgi:Tfp pilus assembly protein PilF
VRICSVAGVVAAVTSGCALRNKKPEAADGESPADKHYDVAVGSFHNGMFEDAKLQLSRALAVDPEHADSHYLRGVLLLHEGKTIVDAVEIEQCLQDEAAEQQRTRARGLHREAGQAFAAAAKHYPEGASGRGRALNSLSVVDLYFDDATHAIEHAKAAMDERFYADRYSALSNLGWAHYGSGDLVTATADLRQAVLLNPDFCVARYRLAQVYLDSNLPEQALEQAAFVTGNPRCPIQDAQRLLGAAHLRLGQDDEAEAAFGTCVEMAPKSCLAQECSAMLQGAGAGSAVARRPSASDGSP